MTVTLNGTIMVYMGTDGNLHLKTSASNEGCLKDKMLFSPTSKKQSNGFSREMLFAYRSVVPLLKPKGTK